MTSFGSYNDDKRISGKLGKDTYKASSLKQPVTHGTESRKVPTKSRPESSGNRTQQPANYEPQQHQYVNTLNPPVHVTLNGSGTHFANNDNALPWKTDAKNGGKNFYENYSKENDRRKKEGKSRSWPVESLVDSTTLYFYGKFWNLNLPRSLFWQTQVIVAM